MRGLFWTVIPMNKCMGTIWEKMEDEKISFNQIKFEEQYSQKKTEKKEEGEVKKEGNKVAEKPQSQLTGPRQQNINIVLGKVKIKLPDLKVAMLSYNSERLTQTICELLM